MPFREHIISLDKPLLRELARWLLAFAPGADDGDLTSYLVLLPGKRPCESFKHVLLQESGRAALLLPEIVTPAQLVELLAARLGLLEREVPPHELRAILLAHQLDTLPQASAFVESTPGLAEELVTLFDEVRLAGSAEEVLLGRHSSGESIEQPDPARELHEQDLLRIRSAWQIYRRVVPYDATDRLLAVADALGTAIPHPVLPWSSLIVAGFTTVDRTTVALLRSLADQLDSHLFTLGADDPLSRLFLASFFAVDSVSHPLAAARGVAASLAGQGADEPVAEDSAPADGERLPGAEPAPSELAECGCIDLRACGDPETESRTIASLVVEELDGWRNRVAAAGAPGDRSPRIAVATADPDLARRLAAQFKDAGVRFDDTSGIPLSQEPAGLLAGHLLRTAVTDLRHGPLLELLTHPFVDLCGDRPRHLKWTLHFEKMIRGKHQVPGLAGYRRHAEAWDDAAREALHASERCMGRFVDDLGEAMSPLIQTAGRPEVSWQEHLSAFRQVWQNIAPGRELAGEDVPRDQQDQRALGRLLDDLEAVADRIPAVDLATFSAEMMRLLTDRKIWPHRDPHLPVLLTGLLEARLEYYDLLILAGMSEDVFPGRISRPLFLSRSARERMGLPVWNEELGRKAELFLRLLHNGRAVIVTWSSERLGQPCLPSPFVFRLGLSGSLLCTRAPRVPLYRREEEAPPHAAIAADQNRFDAEPAEIAIQAPTRSLARFSHSALKIYRDCPYRFALERGFGLKKEEDVLEEFRRLDYGNLVHDCLCRFLAADSEGRAALARGDEAAALAALRAEAATVFGAGAEELPQRRLWEEAFRETARALIAWELERFAEGWRPAVLEGEFALPLAAVRDWLVANVEPGNEPSEEPAAGSSQPVVLPAEAERLLLVGKIDRIDMRAADRPAGSDVAVIDYKTGPPPSPASVKDGRELQIVLYALAAAAGGVADLGRAGDIQVVHGAYYQIKRDRCGFDAVKPHLDATTGDGRCILRRGAHEILAVALAARDRDHPYPLVPEHWAHTMPGTLPCRLCAFPAVCRLEERRLPPHLEVRLRKELVATRQT